MNPPVFSYFFSWHEGPADFALRAAQIGHITQRYIGLRYGRQRDAVRALR